MGAAGWRVFAVIKIQQMQERDVKACAALYLDVFTQPPWNETITPQRALEILTHLYHKLPDCFGLIATHNDTIIGFLIGYAELLPDKTDFKIKEFAVTPTYQQQGIGTNMLNTLQVELQKQGFDSLSLTTYRDTQAQQFYENRGFYLIPKPVLMGKDL